MRTVIVLDALSEITTPMRTLRAPCTGACTGASGAAGAFSAAFALERSCKRRARRRTAPARRAPTRSAWRSSGERCGLGSAPCCERTPPRRRLGVGFLAVLWLHLLGSSGGLRLGALRGGGRLTRRLLVCDWGVVVGFLVGHSLLSESSYVCSRGLFQPRGAPSAANSRSRATVRARARSRLARPTAAVLSSSPVACAKRRPKSSLRSVASCLASSASSRSRSALACIALVLARHELRFDRELVRGEADRVACER